MNKKYTVIVRIKVNKSKKSVVGNSLYDNKSYNHKFKSAVLNAVYIDYHNNHKKYKSGSDYNYTLVNHSIAYLHTKPKHARKGVNLRIHQQIINENKKRIEEKDKDKYQSKKSIKDMYKKEPKHCADANTAAILIIFYSIRN